MGLLGFLKNNSREKNDKILLIQIGKIRAYANTSCVFEVAFKKYGKFDILIDEINLEFAKYDERIEQIFTINSQNEQNLTKQIFEQNYSAIYIFSPDELALRIAKNANCKNVSVLSHYKNPKNFASLSRGFRVIEHNKDHLLVDSFLSMFDANTDLGNYKKSLQKPIFVPDHPVFETSRTKIGICLDSTNKAKIIPPDTWQKIFDILAKFEDVEVFIFGKDPDEKDILSIVNTYDIKVTSLILRIKLHEVPYYIGNMDLFISSETSNYHIADSMNVATICLMGPCKADEVDGVGPSLIISSHKEPVLSFFDDDKKIDADSYYELDDNDCNRIEEFLADLFLFDED